MIRPTFLRPLIAAAALAASAAAPALAADSLTLQLKWLPQAQFAGYYAAKAQGFYDDAGLDVEIRAGGPDINPSQVIAGGGADVVVDWMPSALATREKGVPLVNIAQVFQKSGLMLTCRKDSGITKPDDFKGQTIGVWFGGNEYPFLAWMSKLGFSTSGSDPDITILKQGFNVDPILQNQAPCISTEIYNEYWQVADGGIPQDQLITFKYEDYGVATLEDGLWVLEEDLEDPATVEKLGRFVKATNKGWAWALENQDDAVELVLENDMTGALEETHQRRMLSEVAHLVQDEAQPLGFLDPEAYQRTVDILLSGESDPVITKAPEHAWTHEVYELSVTE